jgi:anti-anti-sigma factor
VGVEESRASSRKIGGVTQVAVVGELVDGTCGHLASAWAEALDGDAPLLLDLEECTFIDSIGLDLIVRTATRLHSQRRDLVVHNARGPVRELLRITGAASVEGLVVHEFVPDAS